MDGIAPANKIAGGGGINKLFAIAFRLNTGASRAFEFALSGVMALVHRRAASSKD